MRPQPTAGRLPFTGREDDVDHTTVKSLRYPTTQGYARPLLATPTAGDDTRRAGPSPARVNRFNDYPGE